MTTAGSDMMTDAGESSSSSSTAISTDVLKEALKEVLTENPSLLTAAGRQPDDDAGHGKENSSCLACRTSWLVESCRPHRGC